MKRIITITFLIFILIPPTVFAEEILNQINGDPTICEEKLLPYEAPPEAFQSIGDLEKWAKTSTFGGGEVEMISFKEQQLAVAKRMFTSGAVTSDISVYAYNKDGSYTLKNMYHAIYDTIRTDLTDDSLLFISEKCDETLVEITLESLLPN